MSDNGSELFIKEVYKNIWTICKKCGTRFHGFYKCPMCGEMQ